MSEEVIMRKLKQMQENDQRKRLEEPKVKPKSIAEPRKRTINWQSIAENIKKYDSLSKSEQREADRNWGRTIPKWREALGYHKQGLTDEEVKAKMGWK